MNTIHLTDEELAFVRQSVGTNNDMMADTFFEEVTANLYPRGDEITTLNQQQAQQLREELLEQVRKEVMRHNLCAKLGIQLNENGFCK